MWNLQRIIFVWRQRYWQIFKSALAYLLRKSTRTTKKISFLLNENLLLSTLPRRVLFFLVFGTNGVILNLPVEKGCNSESSIIFRKAAYLNESLGVVLLLRLNTKENYIYAMDYPISFPLLLMKNSYLFPWY